MELFYTNHNKVGLVNFVDAGYMYDKHHVRPKTDHVLPMVVQSLPGGP